VVWRSVKGPGKPYWRMPEGLTGEVGMGTGPDRLRLGPGRERGAEVVAVGGGRDMRLLGGGDCRLDWEE
jgi:hypothetical protein